ncbi:uncharacterized protein EAE97_004343 [Botrytis byssoidea]|uniref:Uncharacterized protein n=1 Tax=Botrytis byssoidea TaxID=139641 RepID=A0A9P5IMG9_9HELO|nr:uncharacterized protein EAE97_004343 [Botrytis byssoidea]KAF7947094.1 hypothetical protein EAE97_004343 [Botrytis byssoidea]
MQRTFSILLYTTLQHKKEVRDSKLGLVVIVIPSGRSSKTHKLKDKCHEFGLAIAKPDVSTSKAKTQRCKADR